MTIDIEAARQFVHANGRVIERHRLATLIDGAPIEPLLTALRAYRNSDGGFGHALEPDVRVPREPARGNPPGPGGAGRGRRDGRPDAGRRRRVGRRDLPARRRGADRAALCRRLPAGTLDGAVRGRWLPHLRPRRQALAGRSGKGWLDAATEWCWSQLEGDEPAGGYTVKFAIDFLDAVPDPPRAAAALERMRPALDADGCLAVPGGTENEKLTPLDFSPRPGCPAALCSPTTRSRPTSTVSRPASARTADGRSSSSRGRPAQALEWRGIATVLALGVLRANGRVAS